MHLTNEYTIVFDVGGTWTKSGLFRKNKLLVEHAIASKAAAPLSETLQVFFVEINRLLERHKIGKALAGIGFAMAALVDVQNAKVFSTNDKYKCLENFNMAHWVFSNWQVPCFMDNDARMALVGEWRYGTAQGIDSAVMMTLGTGVGTAAVVEGVILRGKHYQAGSLGGHFTIDFRGEKCNCGNHGCVEMLAASWNLTGRIQQHPAYRTSVLSKSKTVDFRLLFEAACSGDVVAVDIREHCLDSWSAGIVNLIHAYDPEIVVLGGGVMKSAAHILPKVRKRVHERAWTPCGKVPIVPSLLKERAALFGIHYSLQQKDFAL